MTVVSLQVLDYDSVINLAKIAEGGYIAVDTESGETRGMMGISLAFRTPLGVHDYYLPVRHDELNLSSDQLERLYSVFSNATLIFHNAVYDLWVLHCNGYDHPGRHYDTMLMAHWIDENQFSYGLDAVAPRYGSKPKNRSPEMQFIIDNWGWDAVPLSLMSLYSSNDALITFEAWEVIYKEFCKQGFDGPLWERECKFNIGVMGPLVRKGIRVDPEFCIREIMRGERRMVECAQLVGFNPGSSKALERFLLDEMGFPVHHETPSGKPSFDKKAMEFYDELLSHTDNKKAKYVLEYRGWQITIGLSYKNFIKYMDSENVLHPGYKLHGTRTGRLSCERPNLQQIPKISEKDWNGGLKKAFIPRDGFSLWGADYSQLEFRLAACYAEEPVLYEIFRDSSRSLFKEMSSALGWPYDKTKTFNYSTMYGGGANNTSRIFGVTIFEARQLINQYYKAYPGLRKAMKRAERACKSRSYVKYWTGRRRHLRPIDSHKAFNAVVQGGGFEIVKDAMIRLQEEVCDENCYMVLQVHDEVVFEIKEGMENVYLPKIKEAMERVPDIFAIPFLVEINRWGAK